MTSSKIDREDDVGTAQASPSLGEILSFEPDLGASSTEQPLRFMIYNYYRKHFDVAAASDLTDRYISALATCQATAKQERSS
jgi:hypothetical protein